MSAEGLQWTGAWTVRGPTWLEWSERGRVQAKRRRERARGQIRGTSQAVAKASALTLG